MNWQFGCCTLPWSDFDIDRALEGIKAAGFSSVGIGFRHQGNEIPSVESGRDGAREVGIKLDALRLSPAMLLARWQGDTGADDFRTRIEQANILGVRYLVTTGASTNESAKMEQKENSEPQFLARMSQVVPYAMEKGVAILLKTHEGNTASGPLMRATLNKIGSPWVRACYDPGEVRFHGLSPEVDMLHVMPYLSGLLLKDHRGAQGERDFRVLGEGDVDFRRLFRTLRRNRFAGPVLVEDFRSGHIGGSTAEQIDESASKSYAFLQNTTEQMEAENR